MKIAILQNCLDTIGGAERVGLTMARELGADIYTTNINEEKIIKMGFSELLPRIFSIGKVPINAPYRQQMILLRFGVLNLKKKYDFYIINGDWALSGAKNNKPNLWYVNATIREIWDLYKYVRKNNVKQWQRLIFDAWVLFNRRLNKRHIKHVGKIASNSKYTAERVKKYLGRNSEIIFPPTDTKKFSWGKDHGYWLSVNRIISYKRIDIQVKAFAGLSKEKLIILGPHENSEHCENYYQYIKKACSKNITLIDQADSFDQLTEFYANCKGFITTCHMEDFGMTAVEAMASGKPVIAPAEGGYLETVIDNKTGILIDQIDPSKLKEAVLRLSDNTTQFKDACLLQAKKFDTNIFIKKIRELINE